MIDTLRDLLKSEKGLILKEFLLNEWKELDSITNLKEYSAAADQTLELKAVKRASEKLKDILSKVIDVQEFKIEKKDPKDNLFSL